MKYKAASIDELRARTATLLSELRRRSHFDRSAAEIPVLTDVVRQSGMSAAALVSGADISSRPEAEGQRFSEAQVRLLISDVLDSVLRDPDAHTAFLLDETLRLRLVQAAQDAFANVFFDLRQQVVNRVAEAMRSALEDRLRASAGSEGEREDAALAPLSCGGNARNPL